MLPLDKRLTRVKPTLHVIQGIKDRKHLFPDNANHVYKCYSECLEAIRDPMKGIILQDNRPNVQSTYICIFVGKTGHIIGVPFTFTDSYLVPLTIKDVRNDFNNPNWFVKPYNEIAKQRGMPELSLVFK